MQYSRLRNNRTIWAFVIVAAIVVFVGSLTYLKHLYQTTTYYVLNQSVAADTQVTPTMLKAVTTSAGTAPAQYPNGPNLGLAQVQGGSVYARFSINSGELLTVSNTQAANNDISLGVPDSWVVTSFSVPANQAMDGQIQRGEYFDIMVVTSTGTFYPFYNVLCLNATVNLANVGSTNAYNSAAAHSGQASEYFVGLPVSEAAQLQYIMQKYGSDVFLVLSPVANEYQTPLASTYKGLFTFNQGSSSPINGGAGTDNTFTPVKRGKNGKPVKGLGTITTIPGNKLSESIFATGANVAWNSSGGTSGASAATNSTTTPAVTSSTTTTTTTTATKKKK